MVRESPASYIEAMSELRRGGDSGADAEDIDEAGSRRRLIAMAHDDVMIVG